ncbi:hypothetical protein JCM5296_000069 [Sporobolomyces johnsonii]
MAAPTEDAPTTKQPPPGLVARSYAALTTAWSLKHYIPTLVSTLVSYYVTGPPHESWPLNIALFTALARYQTASAIAERRLHPEKKIDPVKAIQKSRRRLEGLNLPEPKNGFAVGVEWKVKGRGLKGVLEEMDKEETGDRTLKAEWVTHNSLMSGERQPNDKVVLYLHGGAYCLLSLKSHRPLCINISKQLACRVFSVDYRLSPEVVFPAALLDAVSAYYHLTEELRIPASNIIVSGDSAGGNLALALMLYLRDNGLAQVGGGILISPWVDMTASLASWDDNKDFDYLAMDSTDPLLPSRLFLGPSAYDALVASPYVSPALSASLHSLPPLLIQSGGAETLRDEHTLLAQRCDRAGVDTTHEVLDDGVHVFQAIMKDTSARVGLGAIGAWARSRPEGVQKLEGDAWDEVGRRLSEEWEKRKDVSPAKPRERGADGERTGRFVYEPVTKAAPPIRLREDAHDAAKKAVEENEKHEPRMGLTVVYRARRNEAFGGSSVFSRVWGRLHL